MCTVMGRRVFAAVQSRWRNLVRMKSDKFCDDKRPIAAKEAIQKLDGEEPEVQTNLGWHRPVRQQPPKVRLGFLSEDFFQFFYLKTGVTGPYVFMTTVSAFLISKEIYVMNHEYYSGLSVLVILYVGCKKLGPPLAEFLDKEVDEYEALWNKGRNNEKNALRTQIDHELKMQRCSEGQMLLVEAKRENVGLQYEEAYRKRLIAAHEAVVRRLNYHVRQAQIRKRFMQENAVEWIVSQVVKSYAEKIGKEDVEVCIECLKQLAAKEVS